MCTGRMTIMTLFDRRLLENPHLLRYPHPANGRRWSASLRRTSMYASLLGISDALYLGIFQKPPAEEVLNRVLEAVF